MKKNVKFITDNKLKAEMMTNPIPCWKNRKMKIDAIEKSVAPEMIQSLRK